MLDQIAILLLAAGSSSRMGQSKQLLKIGQETLLSKTVKEALKTTKDVFVVLGSDFDVHQKEIGDLAVTVVRNENWEKGMGSSIKAGLKKITDWLPDTEAMIVIVCDQPQLTSEHLERLVHAAKETNKPIVASAYAETLGVPVLFERSIFKKLRAVPDDAGAKKFILQSPDEVTSVDFPEGSIDLDTPEAYNDYLKR